MAELPLILAICIALPLAGAFAAALANSLSRARSIAIAALAATLLPLLGALREVLAAGGGALAGSGSWLTADGLNAVPMVLFAGIALITAIAVPRRDLNRAFLISLLTLTASTLAAYAAANLLVFLAAWIVPALVFRAAGDPIRRMPAFVLAASALSLASAVVLIGIAGGGMGMIGPRAADGMGGPWAFAFLTLAVILRAGVFPFHRAAVALFDGGSIPLAALLVNSHLGVFLIARVAMPLFPGIAEAALPWVGGLALFTTLYAALLGIAEREPRRVLAMLMVSQSSAILAGLATASHVGIAGALVQWMVLAVSSTVLFAVYRSLEARIDRPFGGSGFLGLASSMPGLAVFFAIAGLSMVGLPGTLGFAGEDLLIHGVLAGYSWWGAALPAAIALNAYHAFRLFARLFLGRDATTGGTAADALPRERWAFSACLAFLVWGGLVPRHVVALQAPAASALERTSESGAARHP